MYNEALKKTWSSNFKFVIISFMKNTIKFIYFDMGGVLFKWRNALVNLANYCNTPYEKIWEVFEKYDNEFCRGKISQAQYWQLYKKELEIDVEMKNYMEWWTDQFVIIPETHELLIELSKKYKIGLLTNIYKGAFKKNVRKNQIPKIDYATIIKSCDVNQIKPEKNFFFYAQNKAGVNSSEIFFIDDAKVNVAIAKKLGWNTHLFNENDPKESVKRIKRELEIVDD